MVAVEGSALRLAIGAMRSPDGRSLVPIEAQPLHVLEDRLLVLRLGTLPVGILDAQDELAAMPAGEQPIKEGGTSAPDVQVPCGAGGETDSNL
jgi:hypothetical protein